MSLKILKKGLKLSLICFCFCLLCFSVIRFTMRNYCELVEYNEKLSEALNLIDEQQDLSGEHLRPWVSSQGVVSLPESDEPICSYLIFTIDKWGSSTQLNVLVVKFLDKPAEAFYNRSRKRGFMEMRITFERSFKNIFEKLYKRSCEELEGRVDAEKAEYLLREIISCLEMQKATLINTEEYATIDDQMSKAQKSARTDSELSFIIVDCKAKCGYLANSHLLQ